MKTKHILGYICLLTLFATFISCNEDDIYLGNEKIVSMKISANIKSFDDENESRAIYDETTDKLNAILQNYCFLYFKGTGEDATLLTSFDLAPGDFNKSYELKLPLQGSTYRAILIGNATLSDLGEITKLSDLYDKTYEINAQYNDDEKITKFTWSDYQDVIWNTQKITFDISPNVAKITVTINDTSSESQVVNLRMKRVRNTVRFAQRALSKGGYDAEAELEQNYRTYVNYDMEDMNLSKTGTNTYSWYVPHNEPIHVAGESYSRREGTIPAGSTFLEIDGLKNINNLCTSYRIYPGVKTGTEDYLDIVNFKVVGGKSYEIHVNLNNDGLTTDITNYGNKLDFRNTSYKIKLPEKNNCYMIHPKVQRAASGQTVYEMPIHQRINEYWGTNWGYTGVGNDPSNVIGDNTEWVAEVIWQDIQGKQLLYFSDEIGGDQKDTYEGVGKNPLYFTLNTTFVNDCINKRSSYNNHTDIYGNILVGVKKKGESTYLWSWHLWVTDYYPYELPPYNSSSMALEYKTGTDYQGYHHYDNGSYNLKYWGAVHHYGHTDGSTTNASGDWKWSSTAHASDDVWDSGIYKTKWIMDRNLGAQAPHNGGIEVPLEAFGLYYQYGRKDPFPFHGANLSTEMNSTNYASSFTNYKLCNIKGNPLNSTAPFTNGKFPTTSGPTTMNSGVQNPTTYYYYSTTNSWTTFTGSTNWFTPQTGLATGAKTIFDPCPPGYCIPIFDAFSYMNGNIWSTGVPPLIVHRPTSADNSAFRSYSLSKTSNSKGTLEFVFVGQGYLNPSSGLLALSVSQGAEGDGRSYYWILDRGKDANWNTSWEQKYSPGTYQGQGFAFGHGNRATSTYGNDISGTTTINGYEYWLYKYAGYRNNFSASRGHAIRCIQVPD